MIDKLCEMLTNKIKKEIPDMDEERAEVINYGMHLVLGEIPKTFIFFLIGFLLNLPYKTVSGGFHLKTHLGCIVGTTILYCGNVYLSKYLIIQPEILRYAVILGAWIFGMIMVKLYAPADTENVPIVSKKERRKKKILSYIILTISLIVATFIKDITISNLIVYGSILQSITITRLAYKLTNNKYGYEQYEIANNNA